MAEHHIGKRLKALTLNQRAILYRRLQGTTAFLAGQT
jgi:hypothetical protein